MPNHVVKSIGLVSPNRIYIVREDITNVKLGNLKLLLWLIRITMMYPEKEKTKNTWLLGMNFQKNKSHIYESNEIKKQRRKEFLLIDSRSVGERV